MSELYSFFNSKDHDRVYNAKDWADYFAPLFKSGVFDGDLQVTANDDMTVTINPGYAWIDGYAYHLTDPITVDIETASGNMNRIDNIKIRLDLSNRWILHDQDTGNYYQGAAVAKDPEITATVHDLIIARVSIPAGTTAITQDMITDTRMDDTLCGWVCAAVEQISFDQIKTQFEAFFAKYEAAVEMEYSNFNENIASLEENAKTSFDAMTETFEAYENEQKEEFEAWVDTIKNILDEAAAGKLQNEIEELEKTATEGIDKNAKEAKEIRDGTVSITQKKTTSFSDDGSIIETYADGQTKITAFKDDGSIVATMKDASGEVRWTKTTSFSDDGSIVEEIKEG